MYCLLRETLTGRIDAERQLRMNIFDDMEFVRMDDGIRAFLEIESEQRHQLVVESSATPMSFTVI